VHQSKRCLLDLLGVAFAGSRTDLSRIARRFAITQMGAGAQPSRILFDGRIASPAGAAFAGASTIDALDAHDGHSLTKGHAGAALLPALLALADGDAKIGGRAFLTCLVIGYEIATRAGIALHASVPDYHTSGAWNAIGCAAMTVRLLRLDARQTLHALGIAEYHGPRSQMMRCIDHPTMVKDGSGWGAFAGVSAGYLAADGFTGAPAATVEATELADIWLDLGTKWRTLEQYFKPYPVCRWAQPAMEAAQTLMRRHAIETDDIASVEIETFGHAVRLGARLPATTEEAQYAIGFPVAALLAHGRLGAAEIAIDALGDARVRAVAERIVLRENADFTGRFPAERVAIVAIRRRDGSIVSSGPTLSRGDPNAPLTDQEILTKFTNLAAGLPEGKRLRIERSVRELDTGEAALIRLMDAVLCEERPS
jgi:2-methylcitrate dehydratase PrpD